MAITSAVCNTFQNRSFKSGTQFYKWWKSLLDLALYTSSATLNKSTTAYTTSNEVANGNGYTTKGAALTNVTPALSGDTAVCDFCKHIFYISFLYS